MHPASSCNVYINNKMHKIFVIRLYFQYRLYMFRTVSVHLQEQSFYKLYIAYTGICRYHMSGYCVAIATQQPDISAYTKYDIQLIKRLLLKMD